MLTVTDPDAPSRDDPKWSEFCHWIATSVPVSNDADSSCSSCSSPRQSLASRDFEDVMPYYPPGPPEKTGKHRYVFIVFAPTNGTSESLNLTKPADRKHWGYEYDGSRVGVRKWSRDNGLVAVGMLGSSLLLPFCLGDSSPDLGTLFDFRDCFGGSQKLIIR